MTALDPRLSLASAWIRGRPLALRAAASSLASEASSAALDPGLDRLRQLDRDQAAASFREARDRLLVPDRDRGLNSRRVSLRRPPAAADREAGSGIAARLAISRGIDRGSPRGF
jgi:hypothetical protein